MIGTQIFNLSFHLRQERFFKNRYGQTIYEDILHFVNTCDTLPENDVIIESARNIAVAILQDKLLTNGNNKNSFLLIQAINKKHNVKQSEVLQ